jgi:hypothetical protein
MGCKESLGCGVCLGVGGNARFWDDAGGVRGNGVGVEVRVGGWRCCWVEVRLWIGRRLSDERA